MSLLHHIPMERLGNEQEEAIFCMNAILSILLSLLAKMGGILWEQGLIRSHIYVNTVQRTNHQFGSKDYRDVRCLDLQSDVI